MRTAVLVMVALLLGANSARAEEAPAAPPSPTPFFIAGGVLAGLGVANLATSPLCLSSSIKESGHTPCLVTSLAFGGAFLAAGVPLLVVGAQRRARLQVTPTVGGGMVTWSGRW